MGLLKMETGDWETGPSAERRDRDWRLEEVKSVLSWDYREARTVGIQNYFYYSRDLLNMETRNLKLFFGLKIED